MGLDSVEIVMEVEDRFGITIPDKQAEQIRTVGDFHNCVWNILGDRHGDWCTSQHIFYKLRKYVVETLDYPREEFYPDACLDDFLLRANRRRVYSEFEIAVGLQLPKLVLSNFWIILLNLFGFVTIGVGFMISIISTRFSDYSGWIFLIPTVGIILTLLFSKVLDPLRTVIRSPLIADFTKEVMVLNYGKINKPNASETANNRREVEFVINRILAEWTGLDLSEITPEKSITDDLGVD